MAAKVDKKKGAEFLKIHIRPASTHCKECNLHFPTPASLEDHFFRDKHKNRSDYLSWMCRACKAKFFREVDINDHVGAYICKKCYDYHPKEPCPLQPDLDAFKQKKRAGKGRNKSGKSKVTLFKE